MEIILVMQRQMQDMKHRHKEEIRALRVENATACQEQTTKQSRQPMSVYPQQVEERTVQDDTRRENESQQG